MRYSIILVSAELAPSRLRFVYNLLKALMLLSGRFTDYGDGNQAPGAFYINQQQLRLPNAFGTSRFPIFFDSVYPCKSSTQIESLANSSTSSLFESAASDMRWKPSCIHLILEETQKY